MLTDSFKGDIEFIFNKLKNKHKFSFKTLEGFKVEFVESDDKSINEIKVIQPNGTFKAVRK